MPNSQRIAVIDLGSNTARLIVMQAVPGYCYRLEDEIREVVRLRKGLDEQGLHEEAMNRAFVTLRLFKRFCDSTHVDEAIATATSAVRDAANGRAFVERVRQELGLDLRILDGEREAYYGYGAGERELLDAAALLHDIGSIVAYENHEVHSQTLIITNGLPGFTPREIALIGLLARYHRRDTPNLGECAALMLPGDDLLLLRLAAILRLAEYLERGRSAAVEDVVVSWNASTLRLTLIADEYPAVEIWDTQRNALELMRRAFEREVLLDSTIAPGQFG